MTRQAAGWLDLALVEGVLPLVPRLPERPRERIDVADVGCGQGHAINVVARAFPASRFTTPPEDSLDQPRRSAPAAMRSQSEGSLFTASRHLLPGGYQADIENSG